MRIPAPTRSETPWSARPLLYALGRMFGRVPTPYAVLARRPRLLWAFVWLTGTIERSATIDDRLKRLVSLRAAQLIGCPF